MQNCLILSANDFTLIKDRVVRNKISIVQQSHTNFPTARVEGVNIALVEIADAHLAPNSGEGSIAYEFATVNRADTVASVILLAQPLKSQKHKCSTLAQGKSVGVDPY